jgi:hypothetical protein
MDHPLVPPCAYLPEKSPDLLVQFFNIQPLSLEIGVEGKNSCLLARYLTLLVTSLTLMMF